MTEITLNGNSERMVKNGMNMKTNNLLKMELTYTLTITDEDGNDRFRADKPSSDMLIEEIGRFERHILPKMENKKRNINP